jgi:hypothetical protein
MPQIIDYGEIAAYNAGTPGLQLASGIILVNYTPSIGGGAGVQVGQRCSIQRSISIPPYGSVSWFANKAYAAGDIIVSSISGGVSVFQKALNGGVSGSTAPTWNNTLGDDTVDDVGSGYSTPPITWVCVQPGESWNFNGEFYVEDAVSAGVIQVKAASQFAYFNPALTAVGGGGDITILSAPEPILEVHNIAQPAAEAVNCGINYTPTVAFQQGVIVVLLQDVSALLTALWNAQNNPNRLSNPELSQQYVRLIGTQTWWGVQANGLYPILAVLGPPEYPIGKAFCVQPKQSQFLPNDVGGGGLAILLQTLTTQTQHGIMDLSDAALVAGVSPVCDDVLVQDNHNAKASAVFQETIDMGYYINGNQVPTPLSPVDDYEYSYGECTFEAEFASSAPVNAGSPYGSGVFVPGQKTFPGLGSTNGATLITVPYVIAIDGEGNVTCQVYTNGGVQDWGCVRVTCKARRQSTPIILPVQQLPQPVPWAV